MSQNMLLFQKIEGFLAEFSIGLRLPERKFLRDLVFGILRSQSALLSEICRAIAEPKDVVSVYKRLDINLATYDLSRAYERAQARMLDPAPEKYQGGILIGAEKHQSQGYP